MRPSLSPATGLSWRSSDQLHISTPLTNASLIGADDADVRSLRDLDGSLPTELVPARAGLMATLLSLIGAVTDGPASAGPERPIRIEGSGLVAEAARGLLGPDAATANDAANVLLCSNRSSEPMRHRGDVLSGMTVRHLPVHVRERTIVIGPLVDADLGTSCMRCQHLTRCDREPSWPIIAAQLAMPVPHPAKEPTLAERTLAVVAAAMAIEQLLAPVEAASAMDGTLEWTDGQLRRRSWPRHPECPMHRPRG